MLLKDPFLIVAETLSELRQESSERCSDSGIDVEDEFATKFIYNNVNNAWTDNITAGVAAQRRSRKSRREKGRIRSSSSILLMSSA